MQKFEFPDNRTIYNRPNSIEGSNNFFAQPRIKMNFHEY